VDHLEHCEALQGEIGRFAGALADSDPDRPVPSCPGWSVRDLTTHLGSVHRWAEHLVRTRAQHRIPPDDVIGPGGPVGPSWILDGGATLVHTLRGADPDLGMWAWGPDHHARFWSRRQLHETVVHRFDLELALGTGPSVDAAVATDGIDEFLVNLPSAAAFSPGVDELAGLGSRLAFTALDGNRRWVVALDQRGVSLVDDGGEVDAELAAGAQELLLVLYRRRGIGEAAVSTTGDRALLEFWWEHSALL
jgi:uncharacterized protein (TIGR03083 family)